jgi:putative redox protein
MITTKSQEARYLTIVSNGVQQIDADVPAAKGGQGAGLGPHELLESSLATCISMWIRMQADKLGITVGAISVDVNLKRDDPQEATFTYQVRIEGTLSENERLTLLSAADDCPVRRTLSKKLHFCRQNSSQPTLPNSF